MCFSLFTCTHFQSGALLGQSSVLVLLNTRKNWFGTRKVGYQLGPKEVGSSSQSVTSSVGVSNSRL